MKYRFAIVCSVSLSYLGLLSGCSSSNSSAAASGKAFDFASVAAIVNDATPSGLKSASATASLSRFDLRKIFGFSLFPNAFAANAPVSDVSASLTAMFKGTFGKISGGNGIGYINSNLEDLDSRVDEIEDRFTTLPTCFSGDLGDLAVDFANHADAKLTLKVNCRDEFTWAAGDQGAPGAGMVFGRRDKSSTEKELVSLMLLLKHKTSTDNGGSDAYDAGFGYAGTIEASGTDDEAVEMLFGQFNTKSSLAFSDEDQPLMARIYAKPATKEFELALASTMPNAGGAHFRRVFYLRMWLQNDLRWNNHCREGEFARVRNLHWRYCGYSGYLCGCDFVGGRVFDFECCLCSSECSNFSYCDKLNKSDEFYSQRTHNEHGNCECKYLCRTETRIHNGERTYGEYFVQR